MRKISDEEKLDHPEVKEMLEDLGKVSSIEAFSLSEGGKVLVQSLVTDIISSVDTLCAKHSTLTTQEFVSICADMKSKIDLTRVISRAKKNKDYLEQLISGTLQE